MSAPSTDASRDPRAADDRQLRRQPDPDPDLVRTKIVATLGPASRSEEAIRGLIQAGVDVFRLNMAHGSIPEHAETLARIRRSSDELVRPVGVLVDLAGPKIRLGELPGGAVECVEGARIGFVRGQGTATADAFVTTYAPLVDELGVGDPVMLADGTVSLVVEERKSDGVLCRVVQGGTVRSRQGVNLPGVKLSVAAMTPADWEHAEWAAGAGADFVSLSFVRSPVEVRLLKELLRTRGSVARVVAKIEKREAVDAMEAIVEAADVVMVASNHPDHRELSEFFGVPFHYLPVGDDPAAQEAALSDLLVAERVDLVVLARYMRILSPEFVAARPNRIINIHHSFLPAFVGAQPYRQAHERGVKVIGATAHYVTADLDQGPIIDQDVARVTHRDGVDDLTRKGRDLEVVVLARALRAHLEHRVLPWGNRTVVFT